MPRAILLRLGGALALAAAPALAAEDAPEDAAPEALLCGGVEPFWSLQLDAEGATYGTPDQPRIDYLIVDQRAALGREWPKAITLAAPNDTALALLRPQTCSDGMSDRVMDWTIDMLTQRDDEAVVLTGCCRAAAGGPAPAEGADQ